MTAAFGRAALRVSGSCGEPVLFPDIDPMAGIRVRLTFAQSLAGWYYPRRVNVSTIHGDIFQSLKVIILLDRFCRGVSSTGSTCCQETAERFLRRMQ